MAATSWLCDHPQPGQLRMPCSPAHQGPQCLPAPTPTTGCGASAAPRLLPAPRLPHYLPPGHEQRAPAFVFSTSELLCGTQPQHAATSRCPVADDKLSSGICLLKWRAKCFTSYTDWGTVLAG